MLIIQGMMTT